MPHEGQVPLTWVAGFMHLCFGFPCSEKRMGCCCCSSGILPSRKSFGLLESPLAIKSVAKSFLDAAELYATAEAFEVFVYEAAMLGAQTGIRRIIDEFFDDGLYARITNPDLTKHTHHDDHHLSLFDVSYLAGHQSPGLRMSILLPQCTHSLG
jgi:hypothetical protein